MFDKVIQKIPSQWQSNAWFDALETAASAERLPYASPHRLADPDASNWGAPRACPLWALSSEASSSYSPANSFSLMSFSPFPFGAKIKTDKSLPAKILVYFGVICTKSHQMKLKQGRPKDSHLICFFRRQTVVQDYLRSTTSYRKGHESQHVRTE